MNKCTSIAGHLDSHGGAMVQYRKHLPMKEIQGFHKSQKPLNAAIGRLLASYCPGDHQGDNQQNNNDTMYYLC